MNYFNYNSKFGVFLSLFSQTGDVNYKEKLLASR